MLVPEFVNAFQKYANIETTDSTIGKRGRAEMNLLQ